MSTTPQVHECRAGDSITLIADAEKRTHSGTGGAWSAKTALNPDSAKVIILQADPDDLLPGTVASATASTVTDTSFDQANDFWNACIVEFTSGANKGEERQVTDFAAGVFTLNVVGHPLPATPAAGDTFQVLGYPIVPQRDLATWADGAIVGNRLYATLTPANGGTAAPGRKRVFLSAAYEGDIAEDQVFTGLLELQVLPMW